MGGLPAEGNTEIHVLRASPSLTARARRTVQPLASPGLCRGFGLGLVRALGRAMTMDRVYGGAAGPRR